MRLRGKGCAVSAKQRYLKALKAARSFRGSEDVVVMREMRVETAPGVWRVDFRRPVPPKQPDNGLLFGHERRGRVIAQEVRGRTERVVYLDDANFRRS